MRTFQTRLHLTPEESTLLDSYAALFAKVEHNLFVDLEKNEETLNELKRRYLKSFDITARQFNSARCSVEGKIQSLKEIQKLRIADCKEKITSLQKRLKSKRVRCKHLVHQRKQRLEARLAQLQNDQAKGKVRMCFGSRKLFRAQHHLEESGFQSREEWLKEWKEKRSSFFFLMGSKDETSGNQSCAGIIESNNTLAFRLRLPNTLHQKYLTIKNVSFKYGQDVISKVLRENQARCSLQREKNPQYKERGLAVSYRFIRDRRGWLLFVSCALPAAEYVTKKEFGYIGVDLNVDHLALTETDHSGNPLSTATFPLTLYGKSTGQAKALIGDVAKDLVDHAQKTRKAIVIEKLDFQNKKRCLNDNNPKHARMLSAFAYQRTLEAIRARAHREGVEVFEVNPAYTSQIGKIKFAKRYGLSIHHAAALCIARRITGFSELLPRHSEVPDGRGVYEAFAVPARTQQRFFWSYLGVVTRKLRTALAEHFRVTKCQSVGPLAPT
jgi:IS605 OrfB family transposase